MRGAQARKLAKKAAKATKSVAKKAVKAAKKIVARAKAAQKKVAKAKKGVNAAQKKLAKAKQSGSKAAIKKAKAALKKAQKQLKKGQKTVRLGCNARASAAPWDAGQRRGLRCWACKPGRMRLWEGGISAVCDVRRRWWDASRAFAPMRGLEGGRRGAHRSADCAAGGTHGSPDSVGWGPHASPVYGGGGLALDACVVRRLASLLRSRPRPRSLSQRRP
jgi:hypothetical protein